MKKTVKVVGAIIENSNGEILCALRVLDVGSCCGAINERFIKNNG